MKEFQDDLESQLHLLQGANGRGDGDSSSSDDGYDGNEDKHRKSTSTITVKEDSKRMVHFSFHFCRDVKVIDLQRLSREIFQASERVLVTIDLYQCSYEEGALEALRELLHENSQRHKKQNNESPEKGARICGFFFTGRNMDFPQSLPLLLECTGPDHLEIEEIVFTLRHGNILTCIRKSCKADEETLYHRTRTSSYPTGELFLDDLQPRNGNCALEVSISCANFGVSENADIDFVRGLCNNVLLQPRPTEEPVSPLIQSLSIGPISMSNESLAILSTAVQASASLEKFSLCIQGGLTSSAIGQGGGRMTNACAVLGQFLRNMPASLQEMELLLSDCPSLLTSAKDSTMIAADLFRPLPQQRTQDFFISILGLENVGMSETGFVELLRAQKAASVAANHRSHPHHHLWLTGEGFFGENAHRELVDSLEQMNHLETLSIVDQRPLMPFHKEEEEEDPESESDDQGEDEIDASAESDTPKNVDKDKMIERKYNGALLNALQQNTSLLYMNIDVGWLLLPVGGNNHGEGETDDTEDLHKKVVDTLCTCWRRNELLACTQHVLGQRRESRVEKSDNCSLSLMPLMIKQLLNKDEHVGIDAAHLVVRNIFLEQICWRNRIE